jgi:solute:Na+ symporter, SSS family
MHLGLLDIVVFLGYFVGIVTFAVVVAARSKTKSAQDYFLASKKLPWYTVGASFVAANISTEHFIGMVGWGFLYGAAVAQWEWGNVLTFSLLIWVFLPFYMRGNVATMPEFLERRYNSTCRYVYAGVTVVGLVIAMLGGVMLAGAKAVNVFLPELPVPVAILILALAAGTYTIYGGLLAAAWADLVQYILLMSMGILVTAAGLWHAGGLAPLMESLPEKFIVFYPPTHEMIPTTGILLGLLSVGVWYSCANQFMVQRCLGARSEWDARMGVVMAGYSKAVLPFIVVLPGIIAFYLFQDRITDGDQAWPFLVRMWLPAGVAGLALAGLASAILSTLSAITTSSSTIITLDLYRRILRPGASDRELHLVGRASAAAVMVTGVIVAWIMSAMPAVTIFGLIQQVFFYMAPPIAALFLVGILWPRATPAAATATLFCGFLVFLPLAKFVLFPMIPWLSPYDSFTHHTFVVFVMCALLLVIMSLFTRPKAAEELRGVVWSRSALRTSGAIRERGLVSLAVAWAGMVLLIVALYALTHMQGGNTRWMEAEDLPREAMGGEVRVQARADMARREPGFNLWTGKGEVRFEPAIPGDSLVFGMEPRAEGPHEVAVLVTEGPEYGPFRVEINGRQAEMAALPPGSTFEPGSGEPGRHHVRRVSLGHHELAPGRAKLAFIAEGTGAIGVDQVMLTPVVP